MLHDKRRENWNHPEPDSTAAHLVKPFLFGGLDGVTTSLAALTASSGAGLSSFAAIFIGLSQVSAGAITMAVGEYLSAVAEKRTVLREKTREEWEVQNYPQGEIDEMIEIYKANGVEDNDAHTVANILSKYHDFWIEHMLLHELRLIPVDQDASILGFDIAYYCL